jgi:hypothetical protein
VRLGEIDGGSAAEQHFLLDEVAHADDEHVFVHDLRLLRIFALAPPPHERLGLLPRCAHRKRAMSVRRHFDDVGERERNFLDVGRLHALTLPRICAIPRISVAAGRAHLCQAPGFPMLSRATKWPGA